MAGSIVFFHITTRMRVGVSTFMSMSYLVVFMFNAERMLVSLSLSVLDAFDVCADETPENDQPFLLIIVFLRLES